MALSVGSKRTIACPFDECSGDQWCPHAVQVALATDRVGTLGRDGAQIASQNVIDSREAAAKAVEGLLMWRGSSGTATLPRQGGKEADRRYVLKTNVAEI